MTCTILLLGSVLASGQDSKSGGKTVPKPMTPSTLLEWLPDCPEDWELLRSQGSTIFQSHLEAHALREYRVFRVPGKDEAKPTDLMIVAIRDTCGQGPLLEPFRRETAPLSGGDFRLGKWGQYPVTLVRVGPDKQSLRLLISNRFIVELVYATGNNNVGAIRPWLSGCNLKAMLSAEQETRPPIRKRVSLEFVDELHPNRSRRYSVLAAPVAEVPAKDAVTETRDLPGEEKPATGE